MTVSVWIRKVGVGTGEKGSRNTLKEEGSSCCFVVAGGGGGKGVLTWGNICCIEIETDDSNYLPSGGTASLHNGE